MLNAPSSGFATRSLVGFAITTGTQGTAGFVSVAEVFRQVPPWARVKTPQIMGSRRHSPWLALATIPVRRTPISKLLVTGK